MHSALAPASSTSTIPAKPGCVEPSIVTNSVMIGNALAGKIVNPPEAMLNAMMSGPAFKGIGGHR